MIYSVCTWAKNKEKYTSKSNTKATNKQEISNLPAKAKYNS